ncbi:MAG: hypothetical protein U1B80_09745, partial [Anaerolineaceae bacterium]|nr:hypothetical protein [Anaerolineaceae bacterium]
MISQKRTRKPDPGQFQRPTHPLRTAALLLSLLFTFSVIVVACESGIPATPPASGTPHPGDGGTQPPQTGAGTLVAPAAEP